MQDEHKVWVDHNFPNAEPWEALAGITEEVGELAHAHLKGFRGIRGLESLHDQMVRKADALGDIFIYMLSYANTNNLDLEKCIERAWEEVGARDWQANPTDGRAE
jgi:NTP pyrophosphatase (non-canonical NTP hydrolase)